MAEEMLRAQQRRSGDAGRGRRHHVRRAGWAHADHQDSAAGADEQVALDAADLLAAAVPVQTTALTGPHALAVHDGRTWSGITAAPARVHAAPSTSAPTSPLAAIAASSGRPSAAVFCGISFVKQRSSSGDCHRLLHRRCSDSGFFDLASASVVSAPDECAPMTRCLAAPVSELLDRDIVGQPPPDGGA
jgi:hypothetical protein